MAQYNAPPADEDIPIHLRDTEATYRAQHHKVSWSKLKAHTQCPGMWFIENYATLLERQVYAADEALAIPGSIVQKVWEIMINERVYKRADFDGPMGLKMLGHWMGRQARALYHLLVFPYETQFTMPRETARKYFYKTSSLGQQRVAWAVKEHGLDPLFCSGMQPKFSDIKFFEEKNGKLENWFNKLDDMFMRMLEEFAGHKVNMDRMFSEIFLNVKQGRLEIGGGIDFVYNVHHQLPTPFTELRDLKPGYVLLDGKYNVSQYTETGQIFLYALLIYSRYRVVPAFTGFIDWTKAKFHWHQFDLAQLNQMQSKVTRYAGEATKLALSLQRKCETTPPATKTISIYDIPHLDFRPSKVHCNFCGIQQKCQAAKRAGTNNPDKVPPSRVELGLAFDPTTASPDAQDTSL